MLNHLKLSLVAISVLTLLGCGGGGDGGSQGSSGNENSINQNGNSNASHNDGSSTQAVNGIDDIEPLKNYLGLARKLVTGEQKTSCLPTGDGRGKVISQISYGSTVQFQYKEYDNPQCTGDETEMLLSYYSLTTGDTINGGKALEVNLKFDHGDDIVDKIPNHMLGNDITQTFYTTIVASGDASKSEIKMGIAKPTATNDGSSPEKRANDVSDYTSGKYYFTN